MNHRQTTPASERLPWMRTIAFAAMGLAWAVSMFVSITYAVPKGEYHFRGDCFGWGYDEVREWGLAQGCVVMQTVDPPRNLGWQFRLQRFDCPLLQTYDGEIKGPDGSDWSAYASGFSLLIPMAVIAGTTLPYWQGRWRSWCGRSESPSPQATPQSPVRKKVSITNVLCGTIISLTFLCMGLMLVPGAYFDIGLVCNLSGDFFLYGGLPFIGVVFAAVAILCLSLRRIRPGWLLRSLKAGVLAYGAVLLIVVGAYFYADRGLITVFKAGFWCKMNCTADIESIRGWAADYTPRTDDRPGVSDEEGAYIVHKNNWPEQIRKLEPGQVVYNPMDKTVIVDYWYWGMLIGPKGAQCPRFKSWPLRSGAWIWECWKE